MVDRLTCSAESKCGLDFSSRKKGSIVTAQCVGCDFLYEVGLNTHPPRGKGSRILHASDSFRETVSKGYIPVGLDVGAVSRVVNSSVGNPTLLQVLTKPVPVIE